MNGERNKRQHVKTDGIKAKNEMSQMCGYLDVRFTWAGAG